jgi:excisionase family DNA binding protein
MSEADVLISTLARLIREEWDEDDWVRADQRQQPEPVVIVQKERDLDDGRIWFSTNQAARYAGRHPKTILTALALGDLKGTQRHPGCSWRIRREDLDAWLGAA